MANPPASTPHSDIDGVNRDARAGTPSKSQQPEPGSALDHADKQSAGHPQAGSPAQPERSGDQKD